MPEVADTCECHGEIGVIRRLDYFVVTNRAARLDDGRRTSLRDGKQSIGKRKECIRRSRRTFG